LGDSGYILYRAYQEQDKILVRKVFRSKEQQYRFNFPYQCGTDCEPPHKAFDTEHEIIANKDIVVMGTDGLFDNVFDKEIEPCINQQL